MTNVVSALTARTQLGQIIRRASANKERFVVDRRGEPAVIIMGVRDYIDSIAPPPEELTAMQARVKRTRAAKFSMRKIDSIIAAARKIKAAKRQS